ncbi:MAG: IS1182 family transposase [Pseudomonadota bacterium]
MIGPRQVAQGLLFCEFSIEDHVPVDHLLRNIDRHLDLSEIRSFIAPYYSHQGRPSIDPELMIRMLLLGYATGIRSERRLCEEIHLNLAYRWFCRLDLTDPIPDHSTFSKNRHGRFRGCDLFRHLFETVLARCIAGGLVGGEAFGVNALIVQADAKRLNKVEAKDWTPELITRATEEYFETLDDEAFGPTTTVKPKVLSQVDPAARFTGAKKAHSIFAYSTNYLVDLDNSVIVDVETTAPIRQAEVNAALNMVDRVEEKFVFYPERFVGDGAYDNAETLGWPVHEKGIEPHVPVLDKTGRQNGTFSRTAFKFDHEGDRYLCPGGKELLPARRPFQTIRPRVKDDETVRYRTAKVDCEGCALKQQCCPNTPTRHVNRSIHEGARDLARDIAKTDAFVASRRARRKAEMLFAHVKKIMGLDRLRLKGPNGAKDEFTLAATVQNLRKMAKLLPATG